MVIFFWTFSLFFPFFFSLLTIIFFQFTVGVLYFFIIRMVFTPLQICFDIEFIIFTMRFFFCLSEILVKAIWISFRLPTIWSIIVRGFGNLKFFFYIYFFTFLSRLFDLRITLLFLWSFCWWSCLSLLLIFVICLRILVFIRFYFLFFLVTHCIVFLWCLQSNWLD